GSAALDRLTAAHPWSPVLTGRGRPEELPALNASPSLFDLLGVEPALGRVFHSASEEPQVVLSYGLWQRRFGADPGLIGQALVLDGKSYAVAGVMPPGFRFPPFWATAAELWAPLVFTAEAEASHGRFLRVFGRLRPGATLEQARPAGAGREPGARLRRWSRRPRPGAGQRLGAPGAEPGEPSPPGRDRARRARRRVHPGLVARHRAALRRGARAAILARRPGR